MKETELFAPLKTWLAHQGYSVHSEVKHCDIVARKGDDLIIVELKAKLTLALVIQAVKRKALADSVYIAVPSFKARSYPSNFRGVRTLLRRLELGLVLVRFLKTKTKIEVVLHPQPYTPRRMHRRRAAVIGEIDGRYGEFNKGGSPSTTEQITAYKQEAIKTALLLERDGPSSPRALKDAGASPKVGTMLRNNVYGWFDKVERGIYALSDAGRTALGGYAGVVKVIGKKMKSAGASAPGKTGHRVTAK
jgi:hypothetical protein